MLRRALDAAGHLAIWTGLYVAAAVVCLAQISGLIESLLTPRGASALLCAALTAAGVYLLDRVKLSDRRLDPADAAAHPARYAFLRPRTRALRRLALVLGIGAAVCAALVHPGAALLVPLAYGGILIYAGRPRAEGPRRVKDWMVVKNAYVAGAIAAFATALVVLVAARPGRLAEWTAGHGAVLAVGAMLLAGRVLADAVLCDIDDAEADRRFGTDTLPVHLGRTRTWALMIGLNLALVGASWLPPSRGVVGARLYWSLSALISGLALRWWNPRHVRDLIDQRLIVVAAVGIALRRALG